MATFVETFEGGFDFGFAMAGVMGQYFFIFDIEGIGDFLGSAGQIHQFAMEEKMGGDVPTFDLTFSTTNFDVISKINEGSIIQCIFGRDMIQWTHSEMTIQAYNQFKQPDTDYWIVSISGMLSYTSKYLAEDGQASFPESTSKDAIIETAAPYFNIIDETHSEMFDEKTWLRMGLTPIKFINETWKHSYMSDENFLIYGIDFAGNFILIDLKALVAQPIKWILAHFQPAPPNMAAYNPEIKMDSDFGLLNHLQIYKKKGIYHNGNDEEQLLEETPELKPVLFTGDFNFLDDQPTTWENPVIADKDNEHEMEDYSRYSNMTRSAIQDSVELNIIIENKWQDYQLFDLVEFVPYLSKADAALASYTKIIGGTYAITRISRFFGNNRCGIEITISRDGINTADGDLF